MTLQHSSDTTGSSHCSGAVLLEVILALMLFVGAATVISGSLSASMAAMERMRRDTHAANLTATILAEMEIGIVEAATTSPQPFDPPYDAWMHEVSVDSGDLGEEKAYMLKTVEVVVRDTESGSIYRLHQLIPAKQAEEDSTMFDLLDDAVEGIGSGEFP